MTSMNVLKEGSHFSAFCSLELGSLPIHFQWIKNDLVINEKDNHMLIQSIGEKISLLKIDKVRAEDTGNFTCNARNEFGIDSHVIQLIVKGKQSLIFARFD
jgi:Immunoglobulin I-set domain